MPEKNCDQHSSLLSHTVSDEKSLITLNPEDRSVVDDVDNVDNVDTDTYDGIGIVDIQGKTLNKLFVAIDPLVH
jgi:hypothetical protein